MARNPKPKPLPSPAPPSDPPQVAEATSATEGVAAPDVALAAPSVDGRDVILSEDAGGAAVISDPGHAEFKHDSDQTGPEGWAVRVVGPAKGRWRSGRHFGPEPVTIPLTELTQAQFDALQGDPELVAQVIETHED